jgi:hypothetical protein
MIDRSLFGPPRQHANESLQLFSIICGYQIYTMNRSKRKLSYLVRSAEGYPLKVQTISPKTTSRPIEIQHHHQPLAQITKEIFKPLEIREHKYKRKLPTRFSAKRYSITNTHRKTSDTLQRYATLAFASPSPPMMDTALEAIFCR